MISYTKSIAITLILAMSGSIEARLTGSDRKLFFQTGLRLSMCKQVDVPAGYRELKYVTQSVSWIEAFLRFFVYRESNLHFGPCEDICTLDFCSSRDFDELPWNTFAMVQKECYCFLEQREEGEPRTSKCEDGFKEGPEGGCVKACATPAGNPCGPGGMCTDIETGIHCEYQFP